MTCTCGDVMTVDAGTKEEAVKKLKGMMTQEALTKHMADKHAGQPVPTLAQSHEMIDKMTVLAA